MRKLFTLMIGLFVCAGSAFAQLTYQTDFFLQAGNPNGVNADSDNATDPSWTEILPGGISANQWSSTIEIPFAFEFFGTPVDSLKASANGVVTFDVGTALLPGSNENLPSTSLPNQSVAAFWDAFTSNPPTGFNDVVYTKLFDDGVNPAQLWIRWHSFEHGNPNSSYGYFACVLEAVTNKIYLVDMNFTFGSVLTTTVGVQLDQSTAVQFGNDSIPLNNASGSSSTTNNDYYAFTPLILSAIDAGVSAVTSPVAPSCYGAAETLSVEVSNLGTAALDFATNPVTVTAELSGAATNSYSTTLNSGTLAVGATQVVDVTTAADFSVSGTYLIKAYTAVTGDPNGNNDTTIAQVQSLQTFPAPYLENFETFTEGDPGALANDWTRTFTASNDSWLPNSGTTPSSFSTGPEVDHTLGTSSGLYVYYEASGGDSGDVSLFTSPCIDLSGLTQPTLTFWYHMYGSDMGSLDVEVLQNGLTTNVFNVAGEQQLDNPDPYLQAVVDLSAYSGVIQLVFKATRGDGFASDIAIDDVSVDEPATCFPSTNLSASNITGSSADISWTAGDSALTLTQSLEYGPTGFTQGTGTVIPGVSSGATISGLMAGTAYDVYVLDECSGDTVVSSPLTFLTSFGNSTSCEVGLPLADNSCANAGPDSFLFQVTTPIGTSLGTEVVLDSVALIIEHTWASDLDVFLISPSGVSVELTTDNGGSGDDYGILNGNCDSATVFRMSAASSITSGSAPFAGEFQPEGDFADFEDGSDPNGTWILSICDDVGGDVGTLQYFALGFTTAPACISSDSIAASNITATTADISWVLGDSTLSNAVEYGPSGFTQGTGTVIDNTTSPTTITGLMPATAYDVYLIDTCAIAVGVSNPVSFLTAFDNLVSCNAGFGLDDNNCGDGFQDIPISVSGAPGTQLGTDVIVGSVSMIIEHTWVSDLRVFLVSPNGVEVELTTGNGGSGDNYGINNGVCDSATVFTMDAVDSITTGSAPFVGEFLPEGDLAAFEDGSDPNGTWLLRICDSFNGDIGTLQYFEVSLTPPSACPASADFMLDSIASNQAVISFTPGDSSLITAAEYGLQGYTPGTGTPILSATSPLTISGLSPNTAYDLYFVDLCSSDTSEAGPFTFSTLCSASPGDSLSTAIPISLPFTEVRSTDSCYTDVVGQTSPDVFYSFTTGSCEDSLVISTCAAGTDFDTYVHLLDAAGNQVDFDDDDFGCSFSGTSSILRTTVMPSTTYFVVVEGFNGSGTYEVTIDAFDANPLTVALDSITDNICGTDSLGEIAITVSGGLAPYSFSWDNGDTTEDLTGLPAGDFVGTITDAGGCELVSPTLTVAAPPALMVAVDSIVDVSCAGDANGSIDITVMGGTMPYSFSWDNGDTTEDLTGLAAGDYVGTITDSVGCELVSPSLTVGSPDSLAVALESITDVSCKGGADGAIDITVSGGTAPYTFSWDNGDTTEDLTGLMAGSYVGTIMDANGCMLVSPTLPVTYTDSLPEAGFTFGIVGGTVDFTSTSVNADTYSWDFGDGTGTSEEESPSYTYAENDTFVVSLTVSNACGDSTVSDTVFMTTVSATGALEGNVSIFPNPTTGRFEVRFENLQLEGVTLRLINLVGQQVYGAELGQVQGSLAHAVSLPANLAEGTYILEVRSEEGVIQKRIQLH